MLEGKKVSPPVKRLTIADVTTKSEKQKKDILPWVNRCGIKWDRRLFCTTIISTGASRMAAVRTSNPPPPPMFRPWHLVRQLQEVAVWVDLVASGEDEDAGGVNVAGSGCPLTLEGGRADVAAWRRRMSGSCWWRSASGYSLTEGGGGWEGAVNGEWSYFLFSQSFPLWQKLLQSIPLILALATSRVASTRALTPVATEHIPCMERIILLLLEQANKLSNFKLSDFTFLRVLHWVSFCLDCSYRFRQLFPEQPGVSLWFSRKSFAL